VLKGGGDYCFRFLRLQPKQECPLTSTRQNYCTIRFRIVTTVTKHTHLHQYCATVAAPTLKLSFDEFGVPVFGASFRLMLSAICACFRRREADHLDILPSRLFVVGSLRHTRKHLQSTSQVTTQACRRRRLWSSWLTSSGRRSSAHRCVVSSPPLGSRRSEDGNAKQS